MNESKDDPRDAHLLAALRHAPDRDALPPREVSARILAAARAAVQPARAAPWWRRVGAWLVQPQVAASFGTLAVASIVGLMWSTREPPAEPAPRQSAAEQAAATSAVASAAAPAVAPSELRRDEGDLLAQTTPATPAPKPEAAPRRAKEAKAPVDKAVARPEPARSPETVADSVAAAPAPPAERLEEGRGADAAVSADTAKASRPRVAAASMPALESSSRRALGAATNAATVSDPLMPIDALLARGRATWGSDQRVMPHGAAQAAWWAQLRLATGGVWRRMPPQAHDIVALPRSTWLTLLEADVPNVSIDLGSDSVQLCLIEQHACWRAPVPTAQRDAWIAEIARW